MDVSSEKACGRQQHSSRRATACKSTFAEFLSANDHPRTTSMRCVPALRSRGCSFGGSPSLAGLLLLRVSYMAVKGSDSVGNAASLSPIASVQLPAVPIQAGFLGESLIVAVPSPHM